MQPFEVRSETNIVLRGSNLTTAETLGCYRGLKGLMVLLENKPKSLGTNTFNVKGCLQVWIKHIPHPIAARYGIPYCTWSGSLTKAENTCEYLQVHYVVMACI